MTQEMCGTWKQWRISYRWDGWSSECKSLVEHDWSQFNTWIRNPQQRAAEKKRLSHRASVPIYHMRRAHWNKIRVGSYWDSRLQYRSHMEYTATSFVIVQECSLSSSNSLLILRGTQANFVKAWSDWLLVAVLGNSSIFYDLEDSHSL